MGQEHWGLLEAGGAEFTARLLGAGVCSPATFTVQRREQSSGESDPKPKSGFNPVMGTEQEEGKKEN